MNMRQIEAFKNVMITGTASKAAEVMFITQPAVSRLLNDLEYYVGFQLFERRPNRLLPTPEAKLLFFEVERAFIGMDSIKRSAKEIAQRQRGRLRIVAMRVCIDSFLPELISSYLKINPDVSIYLEAAGRNTVLELLETHQFDLGMAHLSTQHSFMSVRMFTEDEVVCILPKDHHLSRKKTINAQDLEGESFISLNASSPFRVSIDSVFEQLGVERKISVETRTQFSVYNLVAAGAGVSLVAPLIANATKNKSVVIRPFTPTISWSLGLLAPSATGMSLVAKDFSDWVCKYFSSENMAGPPKISTLGAS